MEHASRARNDNWRSRLLAKRCLPVFGYLLRSGKKSGSAPAKARLLPATPAALLGLLLLSSGTMAGPKASDHLRPYDPVVVAGSSCGLTGSALDQYGLYACQGEASRPIPFQIDEVDAEGRIVLTHGQQRGKDESPGVFDANDELVFLAKDAGPRCLAEGQSPGGAKAVSEIMISDPGNGEKSWVYLMTFDQPPERSPIDYVQYDPGQKRIVSTDFTAQFDQRFPVSSAYYAFSPAIGGDGKNVVDRVKVRLNLKFLLALDVTEEDIQVKELGYADGAVRVIVRSTNKVRLPLGIPGPSTTGDSRFYKSFADFPFIVNFPVRPTRFSAQAYDDFRDCRGWLFYNSNNPAGLRVDGRMDEEDRKLDPSPWTWSALTNGVVTFWSLAVVPKGCPVKPHLYFNDDGTAVKPPEDVPGELPGEGWDFREGWDQVKEFPVEIRLVHFFTRGYLPGDESAVLSLFEKPLTVKARKLP